MGGVIERWIDDWQIGLLHGSQRAPSHATLVVTLVACFRRVAVGSLPAFDVGSGLADPVAGVADTSAGSMASPVPTVWSKTVSPRVVRRWSRTPGRSIDRLGDRAASLSGPVDGRGSVGLVGAVEEHGPVGQCGGQVGLVTAALAGLESGVEQGQCSGGVTEDRFEVGRCPGDHRVGWNPINSSLHEGQWDSVPHPECDAALGGSCDHRRGGWYRAVRSGCRGGSQCRRC